MLAGSPQVWHAGYDSESTSPTGTAGTNSVKRSVSTRRDIVSPPPAVPVVDNDVEGVAVRTPSPRPPTEGSQEHEHVPPHVAEALQEKEAELAKKQKTIDRLNELLEDKDFKIEQLTHQNTSLQDENKLLTRRIASLEEKLKARPEETEKQTLLHKSNEKDSIACCTLQ